MTSYIITALALLIGILFAWLILQVRFKTKLLELSKQIASSEKENEWLKTQKNELEQKHQKISLDLDEYKMEWQTVRQKNIQLEEKLTHQQQESKALREQFTLEFKNLANDIFEEKSLRFGQQNKESLNSLLTPLKENIKEFKMQVERSYKSDQEERITLKTEIKQLVKMNQQLSDDATRLATALRGESKTQGNWGEYQLEMLLEKADLIKGIHYNTQQSFKDDEGKLKQPDFIINLPEEKFIIIDSKVSLVAYEAYTNTDDKIEQNLQLKRLIDHTRNHIKDLSSKRYHEIYDINSPDYVMLFVAIEPAFATIIKEIPELFQEALERNVVLVTASTLLATMKTVSFIWKQENQKKNVLEIAHQSGMLYDKFAGFVGDMNKIGVQINRTQKEYDAAMNKLHSGKGNLISRAEKIKELGAAASKKIPGTSVDNPPIHP